MTTATKITFADNAASTAWDNAELGDFDSSLAAKMDADGDGKVTETEITTYESTQSTATKKAATASTAATSSDNVSYSVVNIDEAPESCGEMKNILKSCMDSFDGMTSFVKNLATKSAALATKIETLNSDITSISVEDGTGSGKNSAYSLTLAGEASESENGADETTTAIRSNINSKTSELTPLTAESAQTSSALNKVVGDLQTTATSANKIMTKVGGEQIGQSLSNNQKMINGAGTGAVAGAAIGTIVGATAATHTAGSIALAALAGTGIGIVVVVAVVAVMCIAKGLFHKRDEKAEVREMGKEVEKHCETAQQAIADAGKTQNTTLAAANTAKTTLSDKTSKLTALETANKEAKDASKSTTSDTSSTTDKTITNTTKSKKFITLGQ